MVGHTPYWQGPGGVPLPGGAASDRADPAAENRQEVGVHLGGNGKGGGGFPYDGGVNSVEAEHGRALHCYKIAYGNV